MRRVLLHQVVESFDLFGYHLQPRHFLALLADSKSKSHLGRAMASGPDG